MILDHHARMSSRSPDPSPRIVSGGDVGNLARMDLHCHSSASSAPVIRPLAPLNIPESYSPPEKVYEQARARGMDFVTLTDHDTIDGALELVDRGFEGVIIGEEVTTHFPEDRCKLHVVVWGLTPRLHEQIRELGLRDDCYAFAWWLRRNDLLHSLAHPLYVQNGRLDVPHLERAALLFKGWETLNGAHPGAHRRVVERYLRDLTASRVRRLSDRHGLEPVWPRMWEKIHTGGSDDHALLNVGATWTAVPSEPDDPVTTVDEFMARLRTRRGIVGGQAGHSSILAHQLATVGAHYYARRLNPHRNATGRYIASRLGRFAGVDMPSPRKATLLMSRAASRLGRRRRRSSHPLVGALRDELAPLLLKYPELASCMTPDAWPSGAPFAKHDRMAAFFDDLADAVGRSLSGGAMDALRKRDKSGMADHLASYAILHLAQAPYIFSLFHSNKERVMLDRIEHDLSLRGTGRSVLDRPMRVCLFTDTLGDVNGVSRFIQNMATCSQRVGRELHIVTSTRFDVPDHENIHNLDPVFATTMPRYDELEMVLPPLTRMLRLVETLQPDVMHISTPGPVGLVGLLAAKMVQVPIVGVYHTDFPAYVERLFGDHAMTLGAEWFMRLFYGRFARVLTRSQDYLPRLEALGLRGDRCAALRAGIDMGDFGRGFTHADAWRDLAAAEPEHAALTRDSVKVLYCGRVSVEKNLPLLVDIWPEAARRLRAAGVAADLVVVGDGPYREKMERALNGTDASFLGFRHGEELARYYANSDLFVFPSTTDTLGQVVMEAQCSGLPAIVSDEGGPREIVTNDVNGFVLSAENREAWIDAIVRLCTDADLRARMSDAAAGSMEGRGIDDAFEHFWNEHLNVWRTHLRNIGIDPAVRPQSMEESAAVAV